MKFKDKYNIPEEYEDLFAFENEEEELEHDAQMLMFKFLEEVEKSYGGKLKKKDLADAVGKSPSFISQLYSGDKLLNFPLLAKIQKALNITFDVEARANDVKYEEQTERRNIPNLHKNPDGFWVWHAIQADYSQPDPDDLFERNENNESAA